MRSVRAFTLMEVMIAMAILAMASMTLLVIRNDSVKQAILAIELRRLRMLAARQMSAIEAGLEKHAQGSFPEKEYRSYRWRTTRKLLVVPPAASNAKPQQMVLVTLTVYRANQRQGPRFILCAYFLKETLP